MTRQYLCSFLFFAWIGLYLCSQETPKWDVANAPGSSKEVEFSVTEGTWMNLDVHPNGKEIVFDLLGDIYRVSIEGGAATVLASGLPFEVHPRYSPDGKKILFTSDRGGGDNIWVMNHDGSDKQQITKEDFRLCNNAVWMPDGEYIIAKKHFTSTRSLGAGEMWMYHKSGGQGVRLTKRKNDQQDVGEPCVSPDGAYVYFSEDMSSGSFFQYNKDPNGQIYVIRRYSLEKGKVENVVAGAGGAVRPQISPDGKLLAFVRRVRTKSVLFLHDLKTGEEWPLCDKLSKDQQETWATFGVYPNFAWTPDGQEIIFWGQGKIHRLKVESLDVEEIPFQVDVKQTVMDALKFPQKVSPETFRAKMIRDSTTSPDGKWLVFNAVGHLWKKELPAGKPTRLTSDQDFEFDPQFSRDGQSIVYTTWNDKNRSSIRLYSWEENKSVLLSEESGYYHNPSFSYDGERIVYQKGSGNSILGFAFGKNPGLYWAKSTGGESHFITSEGSDPQFSKEGSRIFFLSYQEGNKVLKSVDLEGEKPQVHFSSKYATDFVLSPDKKWIAFTELFNSYVALLPRPGVTISLSGESKSIPVFKLTETAGSYLHWSDNETVHWTLGEEYFSRKLKDCFQWIPGAPDEIPSTDKEGILLELDLPSDIPQGRLALVGARVITMKGDEVLENATILIEKNRIVALGKKENISIPEKTKIINVDGKTIMPGLVDVHAHLGNSYNGISPQQQWSYYASLAYGTTTTHDPSTNTEMVFSQSEMVKSGAMIGPRIYSTGTILYGAEGDFKAVVNSLDDARKHLRRMKAVGAFSVKSYNQPRRNQRQQVLVAAREYEIMVYPEGGSFFYHNLSMILDGHTGVEHSLPIAPVYQDVIQLWGKTKVGYTPTLIVGYGGIWGENYWYQKTKVWEKERLLRYYPRSLIDSRSRRRMMIPDDDFGHIKNAQACKAILDGGTNVQIGAHGQIHGIGAHWEIWMLAQGGFTNLEALRAATLMGAEYIGMDEEIGSLEVGKIADLIVLEKNPLRDILHTESVIYTMINGRIYDSASMTEVGNYSKKREKFFWEYRKNSQSFDWHFETNSFMQPNCGCYGRN